MTPNWSFWGNLGLAGSLDLAALMTKAQHKLNNHLMGRSARPRCADALQVDQFEKSRVRRWVGGKENILHTVDKRGSDAKLEFLGKPGFGWFPGPRCPHDTGTA